MTYRGPFDVDKETKDLTACVIICHPDRAAFIRSRLEQLGRLGWCRVIPDASMPPSAIQFCESSAYYRDLAF